MVLAANLPGVFLWTRAMCEALHYIGRMVLSSFVIIIIIADVQLYDSCVRLVKHDAPLSWAEARASCRHLGGVLPSLSRVQEWQYVHRAFRHSTIGKDTGIYIGVKTFPDPFHIM